MLAYIYKYARICLYRYKIFLEAYVRNMLEPSYEREQKMRNRDERSKSEPPDILLNICLYYLFKITF